MAKSLNGLAGALKYAETDDDWGAGDQYSHTLLKTNVLKRYSLSENENLTETNNTKKQKKLTQSAVIVNGKVYYLNLEELTEKEPSNNLLNIHVGDIKKRANKNNHTIEYLEQILDFNLVIDYINGYNYEDFEKIFTIDYARVERFRLLLIRLSMTNLIGKLDTLYPLLNINGILYTVSINFIGALEPHNNLFKKENQLSNDAYIHFRDGDLFNEYFRDYLLGKKNIIDTAEFIKKLKSVRDNDYILGKIENDLSYYGFNELRKNIHI